MSLQGLPRRSPRCKICFIVKDDRVLNEITKDILLKRGTNAEISKRYHDLMAAVGCKDINDVNIANHRRHSDPVQLANDLLVERNIPVAEEDFVKEFYAQRFAQEVDRLKLMNLAYKARLANLESVQNILDDKKEELAAYKAALKKNPNDLGAAVKIRGLEHVIVDFTQQIVGEQSNIQDTVLKHDKNLGTTAADSTEVQQAIAAAFIREITEGMTAFVQDFKKYLRTDIFSDDPEAATPVMYYMIMLMDKRVISPVRDMLQPASLRRIQSTTYKEIGSGGSRS